MTDEAGLPHTQPGDTSRMAMTFTECCGRRPRAINIDVSDDQALTLLVCDVCEQQGWFRNGEPIEVADVKTAAASRWNRKQGRG